MRVGYIRVSTAHQNIERQEILMKEMAVEKVFIDKASGKNLERPELQAMLLFLREGDTLVIQSISRFARNTADLLILIGRLKEKGVQFVSMKEFKQPRPGEFIREEKE